MTYEVGQKILVEATVINPEIDSDGDIRVEFGIYDAYVPAADTRPLDPEPTTIELSEIKVGDVVRATRVNVTHQYNKTETTVYDNIAVTKIVGTGFDAGFLIFGELMGFSYELISRPEPEPIKVDDVITLEQVKTLPVGSVVTKDDSVFDIKDRMVTQTGLYNPQDVNVTEWYVYDGAAFTVKYIA